MRAQDHHKGAPGEFTRRDFLVRAGAGGLGAALAGLAPDFQLSAAVAFAPPPMVAKPPGELHFQSATALAKAIRSKKVSSLEVVEACLKRIEAVNPKLNAVVQLTAEKAREEARAADAALARGQSKGPLHGVPMTIKDALDTTGVVSTGGTKGRAKFIPAQDATTVARLRAAGAILLGKTNVPEMSWASETDNIIYGRTNNPYEFSRTPGGSSGGEAAIIAAGGSPFGLGSDLGGSIRLPAHYCGITGLKPTSGRVPRTGHFPPAGGMKDSMCQVGPLGRFVEDLTLVLPIIAGPDWRDPAIVPAPLGDPRKVNLKKLRVAFHTDNGILAADAATAGTVRKAVKALSDSGAQVEEARPTGIEQSRELIEGVWGADGGAGLQELLKAASTTELSPLLQHSLKKVGGLTPMSGPQLAALLFRWDQFRSEMLGFMEMFDLILCPVNAYPAAVHGISFVEGRLNAFSYTYTYNLTGWPGAVVRGGASPEGLPIGVQVVARPWREDVALAVAQHLESALGGWQRPLL